MRRKIVNVGIIQEKKVRYGRDHEGVTVTEVFVKMADEENAPYGKRLAGMSIVA